MYFTRSLATLRRSWRLLRSFRFEQTRPELFYGELAEDTARLIEALVLDFSPQDSPVQAEKDSSVQAEKGLSGHTENILNTSSAGRGSTSSHSKTNSSRPSKATPSRRGEASILDGMKVLDVGGGPGYFAQAFSQRGAHYWGIEPDASEMAAAGIRIANAVRGDGTHLPFADDTFEVCYSSNVAEHIPNPWDMAQEMMRVTAPGGLMILSYTVWLGPFGGHETGLWQHYVGGEYARDRYARIHGHQPKNIFGASLFDVSAHEGLKWAKEHNAQLIFPRYHPWWAWWVVRVPILREFLTSNLVIVVRKPNT